MKKKEFKVGEKIKLGNVTLLVEKAKDYECGECFFKKLCDNNLFGEVSDMVGDCILRESVKFIKVEEE